MIATAERLQAWNREEDTSIRSYMGHCFGLGDLIDDCNDAGQWRGLITRTLSKHLYR